MPDHFNGQHTNSTPIFSKGFHFCGTYTRENRIHHREDSVNPDPSGSAARVQGLVSQQGKRVSTYPEHLKPKQPLCLTTDYTLKISPVIESHNLDERRTATARP